MLSRSHNQEYQDFLTLLNKCRSVCTISQAEVESEGANVALQDNLYLLHQHFAELTTLFKQSIEQLTVEAIETEFPARWQSIQTEIKREFRLLTTNMLLLKSSRQATTTISRIKGVNRNLEKLIGYCQAIVT